MTEITSCLESLSVKQSNSLARWPAFQLITFYRDFVEKYEKYWKTNETQVQN